MAGQRPRHGIHLLLVFSFLKNTDFLKNPPLKIFTSTCEGASFGSVPPKAGLKKCAAYFFKEAKAATKQVRSPAAGEAKATNL